jgi:hypothetical protein
LLEKSWLVSSLVMPGPVSVCRRRSGELQDLEFEESRAELTTEMKRYTGIRVSMWNSTSWGGMKGPARLGGTALTSTARVTLRILLVAVKRMALLRRETEIEREG